MLKCYIYYYAYNDQLLYIGATSNEKRRNSKHKSELKRNSQIPFYKYLRQNDLKFENLEYKFYQCNMVNKNELYQYLSDYIKLMNPRCNVHIPNRTIKEYKKKYNNDNKESIKDYNKTYRDGNKDSMKQYQKQYRESKAIDRFIQTLFD